MQEWIVLSLFLLPYFLCGLFLYPFKVFIKGNSLVIAAWLMLVFWFKTPFGGNAVYIFLHLLLMGAIATSYFMAGNKLSFKNFALLIIALALSGTVAVGIVYLFALIGFTGLLAEEILYAVALYFVMRKTAQRPAVYTLAWYGSNGAVYIFAMLMLAHIASM